MPEPQEPGKDPGENSDQGDLFGELGGRPEDGEEDGEQTGPVEAGDGSGADPFDDDDELDMLSHPVSSEDELNAVLTRRPRAKLPSLTLILVTVVVAAAGFVGGVAVGKHYGKASTSGRAAAFGALAAGGAPAGTGSGTRARAGGEGTGASGFGGSGTGGGFGGTGAGTGGGFGGTGTGRTGAGLAGGNATIGTIKLIDGKTVYVQTTAGDIVQVSTSAGTKVTVSSTVPVKNLQPGETVIVEGSKNSSGGGSATSISQTSLGG